MNRQRRHRKRRYPAWLTPLPGGHCECQECEQLQIGWLAAAGGTPDDLKWGDPDNPPPDPYLNWIARQSTAGGRLGRNWTEVSSKGILDLMQADGLKIPDHCAALVQLVERWRQDAA